MTGTQTCNVVGCDGKGLCENILEVGNANHRIMVLTCYEHGESVKEEELKFKVADIRKNMINATGSEKVEFNIPFDEDRLINDLNNMINLLGSVTLSKTKSTYLIPIQGVAEYNILDPYNTDIRLTVSRDTKKKVVLMSAERKNEQSPTIA